MADFKPMMTASQKAAQEKRIAERNKRMSDCCIDDGFYYPQTVSFNKEQLPEVTKWEVGKEYEITLKVRMSAFENVKRNSESMDGTKEKIEGRFEIVAVKSNSKYNSEQKDIAKRMDVKL